jgi:hypothetical protein
MIGKAPGEGRHAVEAGATDGIPAPVIDGRLKIWLRGIAAERSSGQGVTSLSITYIKKLSAETAVVG